MKRKFVSFVVVGCGLALAEPAAARQQAPESCPGLREGFRTVRLGGARMAVDRWLDEAPRHRDREQLVEAIVALEAANGEISGYEIVATVAVSPSYRRTYVVVLHEDAPSFAAFDCYRTHGGWVVTDVHFDDDADAIFPEFVLWSAHARGGGALAGPGD
ncbi:MAG TPA: hypothetical protein VF158_05570 [Longimicrobiales bacterium]